MRKAKGDEEGTKGDAAHLRIVGADFFGRPFGSNVCFNWSVAACQERGRGIGHLDRIFLCLPSLSDAISINGKGFSFPGFP